MALLSRRDYSRAELRARLLRAAGAATDGVASSEAGTDVTQVDQVLDTVQTEGLLSEDRFVEGFIRTRRARYGPVRLRYELLRHGVTQERIEAALKLVARDEYAAAHALWLKRFQSAPADAREWARQARFLGARGFSHEVIRQVLCHGPRGQGD
ncbi:MAG TPA: regulatory protein RecX [Burkholderiaceae bacterium]|jgi:regulatory protein|nr:regulatory protein RecX [Burkholderiaceae bacterium]